MWCTVSELARELNCTPKKIRTLLSHGCPHSRDDKGKVRIVGTAFAEWAKAPRNATVTRWDPIRRGACDAVDP